MIVTRSELARVSGVDHYDGSLLAQRFAWNFFGGQVDPHGDCLAFIAPTVVEAGTMVDLEDKLAGDFIYADEMMNFVWELPGVDGWGGVAFQRLFNHLLAVELSAGIAAPVRVLGDDLMVAAGKCSVSISVPRPGACLGHTGINLRAGPRAPGHAADCGLNGDRAAAFLARGVELFRDLTRDIFRATSKVR